MKIRWIVIVAMVVILLTTACQSSDTSGESTQPSGEDLTSEQPAEEAPGGEIPADAYPGPGAEQPAEDYSAYPEPLYPDLSDGEEIEWEQASAIIVNGEVSVIKWESATANTTLALKDGRLLIVVVPDPDVIHRAIAECGGPCSNLLFEQE